MARPKKKAVTQTPLRLRELQDQSESEIRRVVSYLHSRILELEQDADWADDPVVENMPPLLRGLVKYLAEEFLDEDPDENSYLELQGEEDHEEEQDEEEQVDELEF